METLTSAPCLRDEGLRVATDYPRPTHGGRLEDLNLESLQSIHLTRLGYGQRTPIPYTQKMWKSHLRTLSRYSQFGSPVWGMVSELLWPMLRAYGGAHQTFESLVTIHYGPLSS